MWGVLSQNTRRLLLAGFGGLLLLMAFTGLDTIRVLRTIQTRNDAIRREFLNRNRILNQIRSDLYISGTYVRDYLNEPDSEKVEPHRKSLANARQEMETALGQYGGLLRASERRPFANLERALTKYWNILEPVMRWSPEERQTRAFGFLRDEVYPRRAAMLALADEIGTLNEQQLNAGNLQVSELFSDFQFRLALTMVIALGLGLIHATYSMTRILVLERQSARRLEETVETRTELKHLSARLVEAQETERRAISRELHDEVGQSLSALMVGLTNLAASVPEDQLPALAEQIVELKKVASRRAMRRRTNWPTITKPPSTGWSRKPCTIAKNPPVQNRFASRFVCSRTPCYSRFRTMAAASIRRLTRGWASGECRSGSKTSAASSM